MGKNQNYPDEIRLVDYLHVLWKRKWMIFIPTILIVILVGVFNSPPPRFENEVDMVFIPSRLQLPTDSGQFQVEAIINPDQIAAEIVQGVYNPLVGAQLNLNTDDLPGLDAERLERTNLIRVSMRTQNAAQGEKILSALFDEIKKDLDEKLEVEIESIDSQIRALAGEKALIESARIIKKPTFLFPLVSPKRLNVIVIAGFLSIFVFSVFALLLNHINEQKILQKQKKI